MIESEFKQLNFTIIGKDSSIEGDLTLEGDTLINGTVKGSITVKDTGKVTIERDAYVEGQLYCQDVEIFGSLSGSIDAAGTLIIRSSASVSGKIQAKSISIYPGADVNMEGVTIEDSPRL